MNDEYLPEVDEQGIVIGKVTRSEAHGNPDKIHPVVHCLIRDAAGRFVLQLRSPSKDVDPMKWDTSVGGHVDYDETIEQALLRELEEELGIVVAPSAPLFLYRWLHRSAIETELVHSYLLQYNGPFTPNLVELDRIEIRERSHIISSLATGEYTTSFEQEFMRFLRHERGAFS